MTDVDRLTPLTVDALMSEAFCRPRDPRSDAYKAGVRAVLALRIEGVRITCPYTAGTAEADAFCSGTDEGHTIWRQRTGEHRQCR